MTHLKALKKENHTDKNRLQNNQIQDLNQWIESSPKTTTKL